MRINLQVPYDDKDVAKARGARWDIARKVWYIEDVEDLQPFMMWMNKEVQDWFKKPAKKRGKIYNRHQNKANKTATKAN